jgi:hypothetical protein
LCKTIIANDQSYNVISTTLEKLVKLDSAEALLTARNLIKLNNPKLNVKAGDVLGSFGTAEDYPFLEKLNLIDKPKGEDELSAMIAYTLFIVRHDINLQEKSLAVFSYLDEFGNRFTKMWLSRAIEYTIEQYKTKSGELENEIAEDEASKLYTIANEKKALRQRYEDLITNLSPMVEVVVDEGY